jgi:hypothetical protein
MSAEPAVPPARRAVHRRAFGQLVRIVLVWNPILTLAIVLVRSPLDRILSVFPVSLGISTVISTSCYGVVWTVTAVEHGWAARRGRPAPKHHVAWYFVLSGLAMPFGWYLALRIFARAHLIDPGQTDHRLGLAIGVAILGLFFLWQTRSDARDAARVAQLRVQELEKRELVAQLGALTAQMNPHLLFNALNTVAALIPTEPVRAEETVVRLADLYRGVLASTQRATHALDDELRICEAYLQIEQARFGGRLKSRLELAPTVRGSEVQVPVLVLQPLVENAIQHGLSQRAEGGSVTIRGRLADRRLELAVEDDGIGLGHSERAGAGLAIDNMRQRLRLAYGEEATLTLSALPTGGTQALVCIPLGEAT